MAWEKQASRIGFQKENIDKPDIVLQRIRTYTNLYCLSGSVLFSLRNDSPSGTDRSCRQREKRRDPTGFIWYKLNLVVLCRSNVLTPSYDLVIR